MLKYVLTSKSDDPIQQTARDFNISREILLEGLIKGIEFWKEVNDIT